MQVEEISSFSEYAHFISIECDEDDLLFRGQRADWHLLPKMGRLKLYEGKQLPDIEAKMLDDFKRKAIPHLNRLPDNDWDWLALAQHHGMATRLLDWTLNPFAALWFAVEQPAIDQKPGVVWILPPEKDDFVRESPASSPFAIDRTRVFQPKHITQRIVVQSGWFTVHHYLPTEKQFVPFEQDDRYQAGLRKVVIAADAFSPIRRELDRCGFNAAALFADLDGLARHIEWQNSVLADEVV